MFMHSGLHNISDQTSLCTPECQFGAEDVRRFWSHVERREPTECWPWLASCSGREPVKHGQFTIRLDGRQRHFGAHRVAWFLAFGPIPCQFQVNHRCEFSICCNPAHLYLGTQQDNLNDARRSGRLNERLPKTYKLSLADRLSIFNVPHRKGLGQELALKYGVTRTRISTIRKGLFAGAPLVNPVSPLSQEALQPSPSQVEQSLGASDGQQQALEFSAVGIRSFVLPVPGTSHAQIV